MQSSRCRSIIAAPMTDDDELFRLNSLHRFTKHSRLVLEAHSHCEVPAGCGGAVLQWLNPEQGAPVRVKMQSSWYVDASFIDGARLNSSGVRVLPGAHVLAFTVRPSAQRKGISVPRPWVMANMTRRTAAQEDQRIPEGCTLADGSWRMTEVEPAPEWNLASFDDSGWATPRACDTAREGLEEWAVEGFTRLTGLGCVPLAFPDKPRVWFRKRFELVAP
jgi:hypothetical protein